MDLLAVIGGDVSERMLATCATLQTSEQGGGELGGHKLMSWVERNRPQDYSNFRGLDLAIYFSRRSDLHCPLSTNAPTGRAVRLVQHDTVSSA